MEKKGKKGLIIFYVVCSIILITCFFVTRHFKKESEKLDEINEILDTLTIETTSGEVIETEYFTINEEYLIKIPINFERLSDESIAIKYPENDTDKIVYSNEDTTLNLVMEFSETKLSNEEVKNYIEDFTEDIKDDASDIKTEFFEREGYNFGIVSFISNAVDTDLYNRMMIFSIDGKLRVASFNSTIDLKDEYEPIANFITDSIMIHSSQKED